MAADEPPCSPVSPDSHPAPPRAPPGLHFSDVQLIFEAVRSGEVSETERAVEKLGVAALAGRDPHGYTPAHWAALDGSVAVMRYLLERGAPVDLSCLGTQGPRPIHWACRKGHASVVQVLLQAGVAVNAVDFKGLTPLMTACMYGKTATAAYLLGMGAATQLADINGDAALHWAAYKGHADVVRLLIYSGVPLHRADNFGSTPLHLACLSGNLTCVRLLAEKVKAELEPRDKNGKTPLMLAQAHRHTEVVALLQKELKRRAHPLQLSELWALLFGGAGDSKGPLLFFLVSVLLWGYPMYIIRCIPLTWNTLRLSHYCFLYWNGIMWLSWVVANRRDPGYLPRNSDTYHRAIRRIPYYDKWRRRDALLARLCHTCRCLRPLRAKHCRVCRRCVAYFDHHCPFIYNCVGVRNRMWFLLFVASVAINCSLSIYFACYCLLLEGFGLLYLLGLVEAVTFCALGWALTCTSVLHACMNLTTNEMFNYKRYGYLRDRRGRYQNPFSRGPLLNLVEFFVCVPDRLDDADVFYEEGL
ncbi:probable protein S-acyltransferase 23 [Aricia agestis]|uniref:probable protein S-acyltransferase 23 n=1 Tax=Aricia agestis TaxID=91739 RepID=UPI001C20286E|nr:probable protein S-acyltransferase 23 [Aricia agestis]XP_041988306.1 probable protein S-acyltransferase 23 [Aricia agestis]